MKFRPYGYQAVLQMVTGLKQFIYEYDTMIKDAEVNFRNECQKIERTHRTKLNSLETNYHSSVSGINQNSARLISDAETIRQNIEDIEANLLKVDKYYKRFKEKKNDELEDTARKKYGIGVFDYFSSLRKMQEDFYNISKKYTEEILPAIINGLNYLFSKTRKNDYEELVLLKYGTKAYIEEVKETIPSVTGETITELDKEYQANTEQENKHYQREIEKAKQNYTQMQNSIFGNLLSELDVLFHNKIIMHLFEMTERFLSYVGKVNSGSQIADGIISFQWIKFPLRINSNFLKKAISEKFKLLITDDEIILPYVSLYSDYRSFFLDDSILSIQESYQFIYSVMSNLLSLVPVGKLEFNVFDITNHGNSISPFFGAKKMLPALFNGNICISKEQVADEIQQLNQYVEDTIQNILGTQYDNIIDYAVNTGSEMPKIHVLILFDFPKSLDESTLSALSNLVIYGRKCGIFVLIHGNDNTERYGRHTEYVTKIKEHCTQIGRQISVSDFLTIRMNMPKKADFDAFISKYMLVYESIQNKDIAFMSLVNKLLNAHSEMELQQLFAAIYDKYLVAKRIGEIPEEETEFPEELVVGTISYPKSVFEESFSAPYVNKEFGSSDGKINLPFSLDLLNKGNVFIESISSNKTYVYEFVNSIIWSFISCFPVTKANISIIDTKKHGASLGKMMTLHDKLPVLFDNDMCTSIDNVSSKLSSLNAVIDERIQKKLKGVFDNIIAYNHATPRRSEICHLVVIYDFPNGFDSRSLKYLESILENGVRCGIYTIICYDPNITAPRYDFNDEQLALLKSYCNIVSDSTGELSLLPFHLPLNYSCESAYEKIDSFAESYSNLAKKINSRGISINDILDKKRFDRYSVPLLEIPIGIGDGEKIVNVEIGGKGSSHHLLIGGGTGGGKSTLMHTLIMSTMLHYRPDDVILYLLDFKGGVEFKIYDTYRLPHIKLLAVDAMQEFGLSILKHLVTELKDRSELCKKTNPISTGFSSYRRNKTKDMPDMPRILLIMDEFQVFYNDATNRKVANEAAQLTKRIVTEGRSYGIHLIMATQSMKILRNLPIESGTIEQMRIRIGLKCGESDTDFLFSNEKSSDAFKRMAGPVGTAVMNHDYTEENNIGLRVAYCSPERQHQLLEQIQTAYQNIPCDCQTFEGSSKTFLTEYLRRNHIYQTESLPCTIHMGDKIEVAPPFELHIDRKSKHNLLVCGSNTEMMNCIVNNYMISAILNTHSEVYCIDGDVLIGETTSDRFYSVLCKHTSRFHLTESYSDIVSAILNINDIFSERKKKRSLEPVFVVIKNLQYLELVQQLLRNERIYASEYLDMDEPSSETESETQNPEDDDIPEALKALMNLESMLEKREPDTFSNKGKEDIENTNVSNVFINLIANGSNFGIYFLIASSELQVIKDNMRGYENTLNKFSETIVFSISDEDSGYLINDIQTSGMPNNVAYYYDGVKNKFQFKPYIAPDAEELNQFLSEV